MKSLQLTTKQWAKLREQIKEDYPPSVYLLRAKMRSVLGFTNREHREWSDDGYYKYTMYLDFFNEAQKTFFLLKYGEYIDEH